MEKLIAIVLGLLSCTSILNAQELTGVEPDWGEKGEYLTVSISGQNTSFGQASSTTYVYFEQASETTIYPNNVNVIDETKVEANFYFSSYKETGFYDVKVYNSYDGDLTLEEAFYLYPDPDLPHIEKVFPENALQGRVLTVSISGENTGFTQGTSTAEVWFNQGTSTIYPVSIETENDTLIHAEFAFSNQLPLGYFDVNVYNSYDGTLELNDAFYLNQNPNPPYLENIYPNTANVGETEEFIITGINTQFNLFEESTEIYLIQDYYYIEPQNIIVNSATEIRVEIEIWEEQPTGSYDLLVINDIDGQLYLEDAVYLQCNIETPEKPTGFTKICEGTFQSNYSTNNINNAYEYIWIMEPEEAGSFRDTNSWSIDFRWNDNFTGMAEIKVQVLNNCGLSEFSETLEIVVGNGGAKADFDVEIDGLEVSFINKSEFADNFTWYFGDQYTVFVQNPIHTYETSGLYTVNLTSSSSGCGEDFIEKNILLLLNSTELNTKNERFAISPNPSNGLFHIKFEESIEDSYTIDIYNANGVHMKSETFNESVSTINLNEFKTGLYIYKLKDKNQVYTGKLILK